MSREHINNEFMVSDHTQMIGNLNEISNQLTRFYWYFLASIASLGIAYKSVFDKLVKTTVAFDLKGHADVLGHFHLPDSFIQQHCWRLSSSLGHLLPCPLALNLSPVKDLLSPGRCLIRPSARFCSSLSLPGVSPGKR
ncbi:MAG: hypothetical protein ABFS19_07180, partial [Thermodesulfobacteriota bacterium]